MKEKNQIKPDKQRRNSSSVATGLSGTPPGKPLRAGKKELVELRITALDEDGYGTCRSEDGVTFKVTGALPGDCLLAEVDHLAGGTTFCHSKKILRFSGVRSKNPPCAASSDCFGCPLIAMKYSEQQIWKRGMVLSEIAKYKSLSGCLVHQMMAPINLVHYRTSVKLTVAGKHQQPYIGIYRRASHDVYDLSSCPVHHPLIDRVVEAARKGIKSGKVPVYNQQSRMGLLRYLVVRVSVSENRAMVVFITSERSFNEIHHLARFIQNLVPEVEVVVQNVNASEGNVIFGKKDYFLTKKKYLTEKIGAIAFRISPRSFFQVNNSGAEIIYSKVREWANLSGTESVLDLYCGIGGIALYLAGGAKEVTGFEFVEEATADAEVNSRLNNLHNCSFEAGDVAVLLREFHAEKRTVELAVLNPPRKGCDRNVLESLASIATKSIIYVSCSPATLARDLDILAELGYRSAEIQPVDMFPQTVHVENVARLEKLPVP